MSGPRFSPRWALLPIDQGFTTSLRQKSNTCPTRPEGTLKGKRQQQEEEQRDERQDQQIFLLLKESSLYCIGHSNNWTRVHDSNTVPPEGPMHWRQANGPLNFRGHIRPHL